MSQRSKNITGLVQPEKLDVLRNLLDRDHLLDAETSNAIDILRRFHHETVMTGEFKGFDPNNPTSFAKYQEVVDAIQRIQVDMAKLMSAFNTQADNLVRSVLKRAANKINLSADDKFVGQVRRIFYTTYFEGNIVPKHIMGEAKIANFIPFQSAADFMNRTGLELTIKNVLEFLRVRGIGSGDTADASLRTLVNSKLKNQLAKAYEIPTFAKEQKLRKEKAHHTIHVDLITTINDLLGAESIQQYSFVDLAQHYGGKSLFQMSRGKYPTDFATVLLEIIITNEAQA